MSTVDFHAHWYPPSYREALRAAEATGGRDPRLPPPAFVESRPVADLEYRLALMDQAGISVQILNAGGPQHPDPAAAAELCRISNDGLHAACAESAGRFRFFAALPLPHISECLEEIARSVPVADCAGVVLPTHVEGAPLDDQRFVPLLQALNSHRLVAFVHPTGFRVPGLLDDWLMDWTIGAPFEDTIAALRLMASGRLVQFPNIRWIIPHLGGTIGFLLERLDATWEALGDLMQMDRPSGLLANLRFDTSASGPGHVRLVAGAVGSERLLHGSDYPFLHQADLRPTVARITSAFADDQERAAAVLAGAAVL
jgi:aminocarboxymuconate-semialdehyde decarboxylase